MTSAYHQVLRNKGAAGIDGMTTEELQAHLSSKWTQLKTTILSGTYRPAAVRRVAIPKPNGGERHLGIPTVQDRLIQQAIAQSLSSYYDPKFSDYSYGFRPHRSAHDCIDTAMDYLNEGHSYIVEIDLSKFFDRVNHDRLMHRLSIDIMDKELLRLIRRYLQSGVMDGGLLSKPTAGTPQGGNLSPILSNIVLDELDKELEIRGHKFVRYADDISIFVRSRRAGERVLRSISSWIERKLKLQVNQDKSGVRHYRQGGLLGFGFYKDSQGVQCRILDKSYHRFIVKLKRYTHRSWSVSFDYRIQQINRYVQGWMSYYGKGKGKTRIGRIDGWLRRRLRMCIWKQWKLVRTRYRNLQKLGISSGQSYQWAKYSQKLLAHIQKPDTPTSYHDYPFISTRLCISIG